MVSFGSAATAAAVVSLQWLLLLLAAAVDNDVLCLEGLKSSLSDPRGMLSSWDFGNTSVSQICKFKGVGCWNLDENRIISLELTRLELSGGLPASLNNCRSLQTLDLSWNKISGPIPTQICDWLPYLVKLDLSSNSVSGSIPGQIVDCKFLNTLSLSDNKLSGPIPNELGRLNRLKQFSVTNNNLSGTIPSELSRFSSYDFSGNSDLCGQPLGSCGGDTDKEKTDKARKSDKSTVITVAITVPVGGALVLLFLTCFLRRKGKKAKEAIKGIRGSKELTTMESLQFDFATLQAATNDFSLENKLGEGGFGEVFKGRLPDEQQIAVKRLSQSSRQGNEEFKNEVMVVAKLQHKNLVRLLGFCLEGDEKLLAYEFMPNKSLDYFLFDPQKSGQLDWPSRYNIILGIARGMLYLHEDSRLRIIHRDLKCSNILLDSEMNPKISDFGMARIFAINKTQANTNKIVGTYGYMSPEYAMHGEFSMKSDVYSFGILLLEIICGKRNNFYHQLGEGEYLASFAWNQWREGTRFKVLDPAIVDSDSRDEVLRCLHICLLCIQEDPAIRPTMATIVLLLSSNSITPPSPQRPAFFVQSRLRRVSVPMEELELDESIRRPMPLSANHMSLTELYPR